LAACGLSETTGAISAVAELLVWITLVNVDQFQLEGCLEHIPLQILIII